MPRTMRIEYRGAIYHACPAVAQPGFSRRRRMMNQGDRRERIFVNDVDLHGRLKNDPDRLLMAARLRTETTLPIKWIASRLQMGTSKSLKPILLAWMHTREKLTQTRHVCNFYSNLRFDPFPLSENRYDEEPEILVNQGVRMFLGD